jgi:hypothetical protein
MMGGQMKQTSARLAERVRVAKRKFTAQELDQLELVVFHLQMLEYGMDHWYDPMLEEIGLENPIPRFFFMFGVSHLMTTMFLVEKGSKPMGGFCYLALSKLGLAHLLEPIRKTLDGKVGNTTLGDYVRQSRNKLMVHGDLSVASLPPDAQAVPGSAKAVAQFHRLEDQFDRQVTKLQRVLHDRLLRGRALLTDGAAEPSTTADPTRVPMFRISSATSGTTGGRARPIGEQGG